MVGIDDKKIVIGNAALVLYIGSQAIGQRIVMEQKIQDEKIVLFRLAIEALGRINRRVFLQKAFRILLPKPIMVVSMQAL